jgi:hypothetical protein
MTSPQTKWLLLLMWAGTSDLEKIAFECEDQFPISIQTTYSIIELQHMDLCSVSEQWTFGVYVHARYPLLMPISLCHPKRSQPFRKAICLPEVYSRKAALHCPTSRREGSKRHQRSPSRQQLVC